MHLLAVPSMFFEQGIRILVGMSTVPEVIVARHCSIRVLAISIISNMAHHESSPHDNVPPTSGYPEQGRKVKHEDILSVTKGISVQAKVFTHSS